MHIFYAILVCKYCISSMRFLHGIALDTAWRLHIATLISPRYREH